MAALLLVPAAVLLAGCGASSGTVTDKSHQAGYFTTSCYGQPQQCHNQWHPECWRLTLRSKQGDLGKRCVSRQQWDAHPVGSYYEGGGS